MSYIWNCCTALAAGLPDPALPITHAFVIGFLCSSFIMIYVYKRKTEQTFKSVLREIYRKLIHFLPSHNHSESVSCQNPDCIRCKTYEELMLQIVEKWKSVDVKKLKSPRLEVAVQQIDKEIKIKKNLLNKASLYDENKGKSRRPKEQKPTLFYLDLAANAIWNDFDVYPAELGLLKLNFDIIESEFSRVYDSLKNGDNGGWKLNDIPKGHWCIFPFIDQGIEIEKNCHKCPNTSALLGNLPAIMKNCVFGNACFSILYQDSFIEPHHGPTNLRLRCHLGIKIPQSCWLTVDGKNIHWSPGQTHVFDDSYLHSATYLPQPNCQFTEARGILVVDFWHPDIAKEEKRVLLDLLAPS